MTDLLTRFLSHASVAVMLVAVSPAAWPCEVCRPWVESGVYNTHFATTLGLLALPLLMLVLIGLAAHYLDHPAVKCMNLRKQPW